MDVRGYLQWVGTGHYPTINDFVDEVRRVGVCKRLPNFGIAKEVAKPGAVIFLVHDQGRLRWCSRCAERVICPTCDGTVSPGVLCQRCKGLGAIEESTGGYAEVDGARWQYIRWLRVRKNPKHPFWNVEHTVGAVKACEKCGGRGKIPMGVVFGAYVPTVALVYDSNTLPEMDSSFPSGVRVVSLKRAESWPKRAAGKIKPGYYATTSSGKMPATDVRLEITSLVEVVAWLGNFALLKDPPPYVDKQFRGLKKWTPADLREGQ